MEKERETFDYIIIGIIALSFLVLLFCISINYNGILLFLGVLAIVVAFLFLIPLSDDFKKIKKGIFTMWDKIFLIIRATISAIIGVFLYDFILYDYSHWLSNEIFLTQLAIFSLAFISLNYVINLIKMFRAKKQNSDSALNLIGTFLLVLLNLYMFVLPFSNSYGPKKEVTLPVMKTPISITIYLENKDEKKDIFSTEKTVEITDDKVIRSICNAFSNSTLENLTNLDGLKFDLTKMEKKCYSLQPNYVIATSTVNTSPRFTFDDFKIGYLMRMEMLSDGETSITVCNDDVYVNPFNLLNSKKFTELYKIKLTKETVNYIIQAVKK